MRFRVKKLNWVHLLILGIVFSGIINFVHTDKVAAKKVSTETISVVLKPHNQSGLTKFIYSTSNPNSKNYHKYISSSQFADRYGSRTKTIKLAKAYFKKYHLKTKVNRGNLVISVTGTRRQLENAFHVWFIKSSWNGSSYRKVVGTPRISKKLSKEVMAVSGLSKYYAVNARHTQLQPTSYETRAQSDQSSDGHTPSKFINRYGIRSLYAGGNSGRSKTIGIISFANYHYADAYHFWNKMGIKAKANRLSVNRTKGTGGNWANAEETTMDVEQAGAIAPDANIRSYISQPDVTGMITSVTNALAENRADVLSISWGQSEVKLAQEIKLGITPKRFNQVMNLLFEQAAAQGITVTTASGDNGAYDGILEGNRQGLAVDSPASSPYVVAVGGTTLPNSYLVNHKKVVVQTERAWGTAFLYPNYSHQQYYSQSEKLANYFTGGGGGFSKINGTPKYQQGVSGVNTFSAIKMWSFSNNKVTRIGDQRLAGKSHGRNLPDVSANADPATGYSMYVSGSKDGSDGSWYVVGGTSLVAPQMAASLVLTGDEVGGRLGFINPTLYRVAQKANSPFKVLDSAKNNNNLYYTGQPGKLYNQATGLGTVNFGRLADVIKSNY